MSFNAMQCSVRSRQPADQPIRSESKNESEIKVCRVSAGEPFLSIPFQLCHVQ